MKKTAIFGIFALFVIGLVFASSAATAFMGRFGEPGANEETRAAIDSAIENNDFPAWKTAMESELTEENFEWIVEHRGENRGKGHEMQQRKEMQEQRYSIREAIENNDYQAWKTAMDTLPNHPQKMETTEENFQKVVEMHTAMENKDLETVKTLREDLGMPGGRGFDSHPNRLGRENIAE